MVIGPELGGVVGAAEIWEVGEVDSDVMAVCVGSADDDPL